MPDLAIDHSAEEFPVYVDTSVRICEESSVDFALRWSRLHLQMTHLGIMRLERLLHFRKKIVAEEIGRAFQAMITSFGESTPVK